MNAIPPGVLVVTAVADSVPLVCFLVLLLRCRSTVSLPKVLAISTHCVLALAKWLSIGPPRMPFALLLSSILLTFWYVSAYLLARKSRSE